MLAVIQLIISFVSGLGKLPPHCLIETKTVFEILTKDMTMKSLDLQLKLIVMVYVEICAKIISKKLTFAHLKKNSI